MNSSTKVTIVYYGNKRVEKVTYEIGDLITEDKAAHIVNELMRAMDFDNTMQYDVTITTKTRKW